MNTLEKTLSDKEQSWYPLYQVMTDEPNSVEAIAARANYESLTNPIIVKDTKQLLKWYFKKRPVSVKGGVFFDAEGNHTDIDKQVQSFDEFVVFTKTYCKDITNLRNFLYKAETRKLEKEKKIPADVIEERKFKRKKLACLTQVAVPDVSKIKLNVTNHVTSYMNKVMFDYGKKTLQEHECEVTREETIEFFREWAEMYLGRPYAPTEADEEHLVNPITHTSLMAIIQWFCDLKTEYYNRFAVIGNNLPARPIDVKKYALVFSDFGAKAQGIGKSWGAKKTFIENDPPFKAMRDLKLNDFVNIDANGKLIFENQALIFDDTSTGDHKNDNALAEAFKSTMEQEWYQHRPFRQNTIFIPMCAIMSYMFITNKPFENLIGSSGHRRFWTERIVVNPDQTVEERFRGYVDKFTLSNILRHTPEPTMSPDWKTGWIEYEQFCDIFEAEYRETQEKSVRKHPIYAALSDDLHDLSYDADDESEFVYFFPSKFRNFLCGGEGATEKLIAHKLLLEHRSVDLFPVELASLYPKFFKSIKNVRNKCISTNEIKSNLIGVPKKLVEKIDGLMYLDRWVTTGETNKVKKLVEGKFEEIEASNE